MFNLTEFKIESLPSGSMRFSMKNDDKNDKENEYATFYVISKPELPLMLKCLEGNDFYPFFDDGLYHIKFTPAGIMAWENHSEHLITRYFHVPSAIYNNVIREYLQSGDTVNWSLSQDDINRYTWMYTPKGQIVYNDFENPQTVKNAIIALCKTNPYVKSRMKTFVYSIRRYSKGRNDTAKVFIQFDSYQDRTSKNPSFYWYEMTGDNQRIMNGGLIFHPKYIDGKPDFSNGEYSIHT